MLKVCLVTAQRLKALRATHNKYNKQSQRRSLFMKEATWIQAMLQMVSFCALHKTIDCLCLAYVHSASYSVWLVWPVWPIRPSVLEP